MEFGSDKLAEGAIMLASQGWESESERGRVPEALTVYARECFVGGMQPRECKSVCYWK